MDLKLEGIISAILTPFTKNGVKVDYEKACALAIRLADQGVHGIFVCGTTGEGFLMTVEERMRLLEELIGAVGKRINVIAQTGHFDTGTSIKLTRHAQKAGAVAAAVIAPGFYTYDNTALKLHYKMIANAIKGFPIMLYNLPSCAKNLLTPALIFELSTKYNNIMGIKDSSRDMALLSRVLGDAPDEYIIINGVDEYTYQAYLTGAHGSVSSTANVFPELFLNIYTNVKKSNFEEAWETQKIINHVCELFNYGKMVAFYKEGLRLRGFDPGYVRPPQRELIPAERQRLAKRLEHMDLI